MQIFVVQSEPYTEEFLWLEKNAYFMLMVKKLLKQLRLFLNLKSRTFAYFFLEIIELANIPRPNPKSIDPTKYSADWVRKKNPTPNPIIRPPPIAQVLLSCFSFDIFNKNGNKIFKFILDHYNN